MLKGRVLVTGGAGFIGHRLVESLLRDTECTVFSIDRLDTAGTLFRLAEVLEELPRPTQARFKHLWHDLRAPLSEYVVHELGQLDYIFHLAAGTHVDRSIRYPMEFVYDNVVGTANMLEYARTCKKLKLFVCFSTDEVFGPAPLGVCFSEDATLRPGNPYAATKAGAEQLALAYFNTYGVPCVITNTMNVVGIRQHPEKFVPMTIKKVRDAEEVKIHVDEASGLVGLRHYTAAADVVDAMVFLSRHGRPGERYNIVGTEFSNLDVARLIAAKLDRELQYRNVALDPDRPGKDFRYALCGDKLSSLGWVPQVNVETHINEVVTWTMDHPQWLLPSQNG